MEASDKLKLQVMNMNPIEVDKAAKEALQSIKKFEEETGKNAGKVACPVCKGQTLDFNVNFSGSLWMQCPNCSFSTVDKLF